MRREWSCACVRCGRRGPQEVPTLYVIRGGPTCVWCVDIATLPTPGLKAWFMRRRAEATRQHVTTCRAGRQQKAPPR